MSSWSSFSRPGALAVWRQVTALAVVLATPSGVMAAHRHALWRVVHDLCVPDRKLTGLPTPCLEVDLAAGYAVVPDPRKPAHILLVPTRRMSGIEDPRLLEAGAPNYWRFAWTARHRLTARTTAETPRNRIGLAINSVSGRSQDQLHIHISCVQPSLAGALTALEPDLSEHWTTHDILASRWRVRTLAGEDLGAADPFRLVADSSAAAAHHMGRQIIVVVGAQLRDGPGFYVLSRDTSTSANPGNAEELLDESCGAAGDVATPPSAPKRPGP